MTLIPDGAVFRTVRANGLDFDVLEAGTGDRLALCLHGFPEHALSWRHQVPLLASLGYRVWAPNQRGYGTTTRPRATADYGIDHLLADVAALIDASGATSVTLIAHDWGAVVAWFFASRRVRPLERLVIMNVPHPTLFVEVIARSWAQRAKSWYAAFFQIPWLPERLMRLNRAFAIGRVFRRTAANPQNFPQALIDVYRDQAARPGALRAMIAWYRQAFRGGLLATAAPGLPPIDVPTLVVWGEEDMALEKATTYGTERFAPGVRVVYLPGISHWVQQDAPERVNALLAEFLAAGASAPAAAAVP